MRATQRRSQLRQLGKHAALRFGVIVAIVTIASAWSSALFGWAFQEAFLTLSIFLALEPLYDVAVLLKVDREQRAALPFLPPDDGGDDDSGAMATGQRRPPTVERYQSEPVARDSPEHRESGPSAVQQERQQIVRDVVEEQSSSDDSAAVSPGPDDSEPGSDEEPQTSRSGPAVQLDLESDTTPEADVEWPHIVEDPFGYEYPLVVDSDHAVHEVFHCQQRNGTNRAAEKLDLPEEVVDEVVAYAKANSQEIADLVRKHIDVDRTTPTMH